MALLKLDAEKFQESVGNLKASTNVEVLECMQQVANVLQNTGDSNKQIEDALENCKKFQSQYNVTLEGINGFIGELGKVYDIAVFMDKKADIGAVSGRDTGFSVKQTDTSKFHI